jgi:hypothetical protein
MKYTNRILLIILTIVLATSCSDDTTGPSDEKEVPIDDSLPFFSIEDGNVWYYDNIEIEFGEGNVYKKTEEHVLESSTVGGKDCFKYYIIDEGDEPNNDDYVYVRTDENGYYIYFDEFLEDYSEVIDELRDIWVKYIDFKNKEWTQLDILKDTTFENGTNLKLHFKLSGSLSGREEVIYKDIKYDSYITKVDLVINDTTDRNGEIVIENINQTIEIVSIKDIGIYRRRLFMDGFFTQSYQILTDHK